MKKAQLHPSPNNARKNKQRPSVSIRKTVFSSHIILSVMSSSNSKGLAVSYIIIIFSPQRCKAPGEGSFLPTILPWVAKGFPHDSRNAQLPGETSASQ